MGKTIILISLLVGLVIPFVEKTANVSVGAYALVKQQTTCGNLQKTPMRSFEQAMANLDARVANAANIKDSLLVILEYGFVEARGGNPKGFIENTYPNQSRAWDLRRWHAVNEGDSLFHMCSNHSSFGLRLLERYGFVASEVAACPPTLFGDPDTMSPAGHSLVVVHVVDKGIPKRVLVDFMFGVWMEDSSGNLLGLEQQYALLAQAKEDRRALARIRPQQLDLPTWHCERFACLKLPLVGEIGRDRKPSTATEIGHGKGYRKVFDVKRSHNNRFQMKVLVKRNIGPYLHREFGPGYQQLSQDWDPLYRSPNLRFRVPSPNLTEEEIVAEYLATYHALVPLWLMWAGGAETEKGLRFGDSLQGFVAIQQAQLADPGIQDALAMVWR